MFLAREAKPMANHFGAFLKAKRLQESAKVVSHWRSEEHTSELQSRPHLVCRLLLEKKKKKECDRHVPAYVAKEEPTGTDSRDIYTPGHSMPHECRTRCPRTPTSEGERGRRLVGRSP